jgi:hypothetical protein
MTFKVAGIYRALRRPRVTTSRLGIKFQSLAGKAAIAVNGFKAAVARTITAGNP